MNTTTDRYVRLLQYGSPESVAAAIRADVEAKRSCWMPTSVQEAVRDRADQMIRHLS